MEDQNKQPENIESAKSTPKAKNNDVLGDFFSFRLMICPQVVCFLYFILLVATVIGIVYYNIQMGRAFGSQEDKRAIMFLISLIAIPILAIIEHVIFELFMIPFVIINLLRDIRAKVSAEQK